MSEAFYHLYYSGIDTFDLNPEWINNNSQHFCSVCRRLKLPANSLDIITATKIRKNLDMLMLGHLLMPSCMSIHLLSLLGPYAEQDLNIGNVYQQLNNKKVLQNFVSFISKHPYITLRGKNPDIIDGQPVPIDARLVCCQECGFNSRRERSPRFLYEDEQPKHLISCTEMGLLIHPSIYQAMKLQALKGVRIEQVKLLRRNLNN